MAKTVVGLFQDRKEVLSKVLDDLARAGLPAEDVSTLRTTPDGVMDGARKGMLTGGFAGLLIGAATLLVPGVGWVAMAGPIATVLAGTALGGAAGILIGALVSKGVPEEDAHFFAEGLRRGGALVIVNARNDELAKRAEEVMLRDGAVDIRERREHWASLGWTGRFDAGEGRAATVGGEERAPGAGLATVCVYEAVIPLPAQYAGPERRKTGQPYPGMDRRAA